MGATGMPAAGEYRVMSESIKKGSDFDE